MKLALLGYWYVSSEVLIARASQGRVVLHHPGPGRMSGGSNDFSRSNPLSRNRSP